MRLVLLTGDGLPHRYLARAIARAFGADLEAVVLAEPPRRKRIDKLRGYLRRYSPSEIVSRTALRLDRRLRGCDAARDATYQRLLADSDGGTSRGTPDRVQVVPYHNGKRCRELLASIEPDVIAVYGTAIIKPPVIGLASKAVINMHTGLSPIYRGSDTIFWPLHNEEPENVGVTVHVLDPGIDSGPIIATARPRLEPDDDEDTLFCKCVRAGTPLMIDAIRAAAEDRLVSEPQNLEVGHTFMAADRTVTAERRVRRLLRSGLLAARHEP